MMNKQKPVNEEYKLFKLKVKHFCHLMLRSIKISYILFAVSITLSLFILFPSLFQSIPVMEMINQNGIFQYRLSLSGQLLLPEDANIEYPITIAAGGYSQQIASGMEFSLVFLSATKSNIPIVISDRSGRKILEYITFDNNSQETTFYFGETFG